MKQDGESVIETERGRGSIRQQNNNRGVTPQSQRKSHCNSVCLPHNVSVIATIIYGATTNLTLDYCFPLTDMNYSIYTEKVCFPATSPSAEFITT